jgi:hypothetical protein
MGFDEIPVILKQGSSYVTHEMYRKLREQFADTMTYETADLWSVDNPAKQVIVNTKPALSADAEKRLSDYIMSIQDKQWQGILRGN